MSYRYLLLLTGFAVILVSASVVSVGVNDCVYKDLTTGKLYDLRPLIASNGSYLWTQKVWSIHGFGLDSLVADDQVNVTFQLQVCNNIVTTMLPGKCNDTGALLSWDSTNGCVSWGNADVSAFNINPYKDGLFLQMYHGSVINNWSRQSSNIYFVCNANVTMSRPAFEHVKTASNQAHVKIFTKYAC